MARSKLIGAVVAVAMTVGVLVLLGYFGHRHMARGVYVSIENNTHSVLTDIRVTYTGGVIRIAELEPGASYGQHVNPSGDSDLEIAWFSSSGGEQLQKVDVYFEPNYRGGIAVTVEGRNKISWRDETAINLF